MVDYMQWHDKLHLKLNHSAYWRQLFNFLSDYDQEILKRSANYNQQIFCFWGGGGQLSGHFVSLVYNWVEKDVS